MKHITRSHVKPSVPHHISNYALYSSHLFLLNGVVALYCGFNGTAILSVLLYVTSILHWRNLQPYGIYKTMDMACSILSMNYITFVLSRSFLYQDRVLWFVVSILSTIAYLVNKHIEYHQMKNKKNKRYRSKEAYRYFSLKYTLPGTPQRELACRYSVWIHLFFLHVCLAITCILGLIRSPVQSHAVLVPPS